MKIRVVLSVIFISMVFFTMGAYSSNSVSIASASDEVLQQLPEDFYSIKNRRVKVAATTLAALEKDGRASNESEFVVSPDNPEVIYEQTTEQGIVTVHGVATSRNFGEEDISKAINIEIDVVETEFGEMTIEKRSYSSLVDAGFSPDNLQTKGFISYDEFLNKQCNSGATFSFGTSANWTAYSLEWKTPDINGTSGGIWSDVQCGNTACTFHVSTSWSAYYTNAGSTVQTPDSTWQVVYPDGYYCK